jgi:hypothetical protein
MSSGIQVYAAEGEVTLNPNDKDGGLILTNGNLTAMNATAAYRCIRATKGVTNGKWYFEVRIDKNGRSDATMIGVTTKQEVLNHGSNCESLQFSRVYRGNGDAWTPNKKSYGEAYKADDVIGVALDMDKGTIEFYKNGISQGVAYDDLKTLNEVYPFLIVYENVEMTANFGATSFKYDIPVGFKPLSGTSNKHILDIEPEKETIKINENVIANLVIDDISDIVAEDIKIQYDNQKLEFLGFEEVDGMKLVKSIEEKKDGDLRVIVASKGESNIINSKEVLLKLKFKGIGTGEAIVDITKGRVTDGIEMEKALTQEQCDQGTIIIESLRDVNNSGEFTLLDLGIDARHLSKDPTSSELSKYNTDIVVNGEIDDEDLLEIGKLILNNPNYTPNK